jgi:hypothetical protein
LPGGLGPRSLARHGLSRAIKICGSVISTPRPSSIVCNRSRDVGEFVDNTRRHATSTPALTNKKVCRVHASSHALLYNIERYRPSSTSQLRQEDRRFFVKTPQSFGSPEKSEAHNNEKLRRPGRANWTGGMTRQMAPIAWKEPLNCLACTVILSLKAVLAFRMLLRSCRGTAG